MLMDRDQAGAALTYWHRDCVFLAGHRADFIAEPFPRLSHCVEKTEPAPRRDCGRLMIVVTPGSTLPGTLSWRRLCEALRKEKFRYR